MPSATAREFQRAALTLGFVKRRQGGQPRTMDARRWIGPPLFFKILRQLGLSQEEFDRLR